MTAWAARIDDLVIMLEVISSFEPICNFEVCNLGKEFKSAVGTAAGEEPNCWSLSFGTLSNWHDANLWNVCCLVVHK